MFSTKHSSLAALVAAAAIVSPGISGAQFSDTEISAGLDELGGSWLAEGYGRVLHIQAGTSMRYEIFEYTGLSCLSVDSGPLDALQSGYIEVQRNAASTRFTHRLRGNITTYGYERLAGLPQHCRNGGTGTRFDPLVNFDVFWETFDELYAFFDRRGVDWEARRSQFRSQLNAGSSAEALFEVLTQMVTPLCDAHIELASEFADFNGGVNASCWGGNTLLLEILEELDNQQAYSDPFTYFQEVFRPSVLQIIENGYLEGPLSSAAGGKIHWGDLGGGVGYFSILQMTNFESDDATPEQDLAALAPILDTAMASFAGKDALVIDIRMNTGGYDGVAVALAERFADQPRVAFTKRTRWGNGFTDKDAHVLNPPESAGFTGPIAVLTSTLTASAAENFLLAMRSLPHVTVVGETTYGVHSDVLQRRLPNGWTFGLSNEIYHAPDGTLYEGQGIGPDVAVEALRAADRQAGRDAGIEAALAYLDSAGIDPGLAGTWWNPARDGEGYMFNYFTIGPARYLFVAFYTYDADGNQAYLVGVTTDFTNPVTIDMSITEGGVFGPDYNPATRVQDPWGTLIVDFANCMEATVTLVPSMQGFQGYSTPIQRFGLDDLVCP